MQRILFATVVTPSILFVGLASARGISLFGDARLGGDNATIADFGIAMEF